LNGAPDITYHDISLSSLNEASIALHINCWQIFNYLKSYTEISEEFPGLFPSKNKCLEKKIKEIEETFKHTNDLFESLFSMPENQQTDVT
jgi:hypothetical protein